MDKNSFANNYLLSDAVPVDPTLTVISAEELALAIEEFINERFRGIAKVTIVPGISQSVLVCTEYMAFFFKQLLAEIYGRVFLNISISSEENRLSIFISCEEDIPLTDVQMRSIIKAARNAGLNIYPDRRLIKLTLSYADAALRRIYAISPHDGRQIMLSKLCEIFYCGRVYSTVETANTALTKP